jgi:crotonobetaine/carnitine-CoA ligase
MEKDMRESRVVHRVLERQAEKYGDRTFIYFKDGTFSYRDFDELSNRAAYGLQQMGISKGDKVAIMMPNCPEFLFLWFGLSKLGAVEVPMNLAHKGDLLTYMLDQSDCCLLVLHGDYLDRFKAIEANVPKIRQIVVFDPPATLTSQLTTPVAPWPEVINNSGDYAREKVLWSDPACILYTSGTTGPSKGVMLPQNYTVFMGDIVWEAAEYSEDDCLYNALPLFHGNAQQLSFMPALLSGARTVIAERFSASRFWDDVKRYGCTAFNSLGSIIPILYKADPKPDDADNPLRVIIAAATPKDIFQAFEERFGVAVVEIYGMTEFGLPLMNNLKDRRAGSCGKPRRCAVKLLDDNDMPVGPSTVGELLVRPDGDYCMLLEYYNMPDKTMEAWRNLWFHSGDYFKYDDEGYYYFMDRKKDALRRRGENISSYEVEKSINAHPSVLESAAVAVKSPMGEDEVMVCLIKRPGFGLTPEELMAFCEERMAYFMIPRYLRFMEAFPKTATERVQKHVLRAEGVTSDTWDREVAGYQVKR